MQKRVRLACWRKECQHAACCKPPHSHNQKAVLALSEDIAQQGAGFGVADDVYMEMGGNNAPELWNVQIQDLS